MRTPIIITKIMTTPQRYSHGIFRDTRLMNTSCNYYRFNNNMKATNNEIMTISNIYSHGRMKGTKLVNLSCNYHSFNTNNKGSNNNYKDHDNFTEIFTWNIQRY